LALVERQHGTRAHPEVTVVLTNLGLAYGSASGALGASDPAMARSMLLRGLQTLQEALSLKITLYGSPVHSEVGLTLANLSVLYSQAGDVGQEMRSLQQAMQIYVAVMQKQAKEEAQAKAAGAASAATIPHSATAAPPSGALTASSLASNPALVYVQQRLFRARARMQASQAALLSRGQCTFVASGTNRSSHAIWFKCLTCTPPSSASATGAPAADLGLCPACKDRCHAGHELVQQDPALFYCDCGEGVFPAPCCALKPKEEATAAQDAAALAGM